LRARFSLAAALVLAVACAPADTPAPEPPVDATPAESTTAPGFGPWQATLSADHPLVGTAWSASGEALDRPELERRLAGARFVLLGETHDHPDHHRLQGELIAGLLGGEGELTVAYEMLDPAQQAEIDAFSGDPDAFAELVAWADSGWPEWALYRPAFAPVIEAGAPILAAQFPRSQSKRFMSEGLAMLDPELVARFGLDQPLPDDIQSAWLDEMFASHCEMVPREQLTPMVEIQRVRDAVMADAMLRGAERSGRAVLVAGTGHTREVGVPRLLRMAGVADDEILSVGFVAVDPERLEAADYADRDHDAIVMTPGVEREDPCAAMREQAAKQ
jgi:uncharacterized iron-regulated protein